MIYVSCGSSLVEFWITHNSDALLSLKYAITKNAFTSEPSRPYQLTEKIFFHYLIKICLKVNRFSLRILSNYLFHSTLFVQKPLWTYLSLKLKNNYCYSNFDKFFSISTSPHNSAMLTCLINLNLKNYNLVTNEFFEFYFVESKDFGFKLFQLDEKVKFLISRDENYFLNTIGGKHNFYESS